jgi:uncharacterized protein (TIGR03086 family)
MSGEPLDQLREALRIPERLVAGLARSDWARPTPCGNWSVRDLVDHLVRSSLTFTRVLHGEALADLSDLRDGTVDVLQGDPLAAYRRAGEDLLEAFARPGVLEKTFTVPVGPVPGIGALHLRTVEALVHGWDLARATGQPLEVPDALAEQELAWSRAALANLPPGRTPFGPPQPVDDAAPAIDRLAALLGRTVMPASGSGVAG